MIQGAHHPLAACDSTSEGTLGTLTVPPPLAGDSHSPSKQSAPETEEVSQVLTAHKERRSKEMKSGVRSQPDIQCTRSPLSSAPGAGRRRGKKDVAMKGIISLWQICRDKLLSVPTDQAQEQSSARTFCLKYSSQPIAQSVLGCQQHQLMCCSGPDSCSGHRVIRYEHHFTTLNIHLPSCNPLSQSIPTLVRKQLQRNIVFGLTTLPTAH